MTTDTRTTNRSYPLPYPSNLLAEDVVRLRDALVLIDADIADRPNAAAITAEIQQAIQALLDGAPGALDTLNELAAALGDDASFSATVANELTTLISNLAIAQATADDAAAAAEAAANAAAAAQATADAKASLGLVFALG